MMGEEQPDGGSVTFGETVEVVDQRHKEIDPEKSVWEVVSAAMSSLRSEAAWSTAPTCPNSTSAVPISRKMRHPLRGERDPLHGHDAQDRGQCVAAGRAHERHRCRHLAGPRGGHHELRRMRRGHFPKPVVPRPHLHAHPRLEGDSQVVWFEGTYSEYEANRKERSETAARSASSTASWSADGGRGGHVGRFALVSHGEVAHRQPFGGGGLLL